MALTGPTGNYMQGPDPFTKWHCSSPNNISLVDRAASLVSSLRFGPLYYLSGNASPETHLWYPHERTYQSGRIYKNLLVVPVLVAW